MPDPQLTFFGWVRPPGHELVASPAVTPGRLPATFSLTLSDADDPSDSRTRPIGYDLVGPGDINGLRPAAIVRTYPSHGARAVELDKAVYVELAAPDLPWRYTLDRPRDKALKPWIVLLIGTAEEIEVRGEVARVQASVLDAHRLADSAKFAHVEADESGHTVARLLSPRPLEAGRAHVAVLVPAFTADGAPAWVTPASGTVELPGYYSWTFETKTTGDFAAIARRLHLVPTGDDLGVTTVQYGPLPATAPMPVLGALTGIRAAPIVTRVPTGTASDLRQLTKPRGTANQPIVGLPELADPWPVDESEPAARGWRDAVQDDFRARAIAGLGERAGIANQDLLAEQAGRIAGAYEEVADRFRRLSAGLLASRSLWVRRVPVEPVRRLAFLGPALRSVLTASGPVPAAIEHPERGLERSLFSSAAQRALRARVTPAPEAQPSGDVGDTLRQAAEPAPAPSRSSPGTLHTDTFAQAGRRRALDDVVAGPLPDLPQLRAATTELVGQLDRRDLDPDTSTFIDAHISRVLGDMGSRRGAPLVALLGLLDSGQKLTRTRARVLASALEAPPDTADLAAVADLVTRAPDRPVTTAFDLAAASAVVDSAFDPTVARPTIADRALAGVLDGGDRPDAVPDGPPELAPDLQLAAWRFLQGGEGEWLLPGAGELDQDTVVGLTTNPAFVDTFLLGLNAQVVSELRFRNYPLIPGWTPVRTFWDRANPSNGDTDDDIRGIDAWPRASGFGDPAHQPPSASSEDLVILFNTELFREYPGTLVSLAPVARTAGGQPNWDGEPDFDGRVFPTFQGRITPDRTFFGFDLEPALGREHWVVLEETVSGRRFLNLGSRPSAARNGADLAVALLSPPRRVLIRGDRLLSGLGT